MVAVTKQIVLADKRGVHRQTGPTGIDLELPLEIVEAHLDKVVIQRQSPPRSTVGEDASVEDLHLPPDIVQRDDEAVEEVESEDAIETGNTAAQRCEVEGHDALVHQHHISNPELAESHILDILRAIDAIDGDASKRFQPECLDDLPGDYCSVGAGIDHEPVGSAIDYHLGIDMIQLVDQWHYGAQLAGQELIVVHIDRWRGEDLRIDVGVDMKFSDRESIDAVVVIQLLDQCREEQPVEATVIRDAGYLMRAETHPVVLGDQKCATVDCDDDVADVGRLRCTAAHPHPQFVP